MPDCVAALDCGTTRIKAAVVDLEGALHGLASAKVKTQLQDGGGVEVDAVALQALALDTLAAAVARSGVATDSVGAVCITNQRATVIPAGPDRQPLGPAISWQDMRGAAEVERLADTLSEEQYFAITGLPCNPVFSLAKILWLRAARPDLYRQAAHFLLVHDYLLCCLGCQEPVTDWSNASLTGMLDLSALRWSEVVLEAAGLEPERLPRLVAPGSRVGSLSAEAARRVGLQAGIPLVAGGGDQQCAGLGAGAVRPGVVEVTLGTAAVPLCPVKDRRPDLKRRVTCCAHAVAETYELEGLQSCAGAGLQWLGKLAGRPDGRLEPALLERAGALDPGAGGLLFFPYLSGAAAPHWHPGAAGLMLGLTLNHGPEALARAVMEGVSLETREILDVFEELGAPAAEVRLTGGASQIRVWRQLLADILGVPVRTLVNPEATLLGAAMLGALGAGLCSSLAEAAQRMVRTQDTFDPDAKRANRYNEIYQRFCEAGEAAARSGLFASGASLAG